MLQKHTTTWLYILPQYFPINSTIQYSSNDISAPVTLEGKAFLSRQTIKFCLKTEVFPSWSLDEMSFEKLGYTVLPNGMSE